MTLALALRKTFARLPLHARRLRRRPKAYGRVLVRKVYRAPGNYANALASSVQGLFNRLRTVGCLVVDARQLCSGIQGIRQLDRLKAVGIKPQGCNAKQLSSWVERVFSLPRRGVALLQVLLGMAARAISRIFRIDRWTVLYWLGFYGLLLRETLFPRYGREHSHPPHATNGDISMPANGMRFAFGKNWKDFIEKNFTEERVEISKQHLMEFIGHGDLKGKYFLDIGCGSGLHSLAAFRAGASRIVSFDYDPDSVRTTNMLRALVGSPNSWTVMQGSALDRAFMATLGKADIVYSWGVLHHTGSMWEAIENAASALKEDSIFYVALYDPTFMQPSVEYWVEKKQEYNKNSWITKKCMEYWYVWKFIMQSDPRRFGEYQSLKRNYRRGAGRGMSLHTDIRDWLGGWPFEYATPAEVEDFCYNKLGLKRVNLATGHACSEYLYIKAGADYQKRSMQYQRIPLSPPYHAVRGCCYYAELPSFEDRADTNETPERSDIVLLEDGKAIGYPHTLHENICTTGVGRYSHWYRQLYFSTSDNSDPNTNGRCYEIGLPMGEDQ